MILNKSKILIKVMKGYVVYCVCVGRGGRKRPVPKGNVYGEATNQGVAQLKFQRSKSSVAQERAGRKLSGHGVLNCYWINEVTMICIHNSELKRNSNYSATKFEAFLMLLISYVVLKPRICIGKEVRRWPV